MKPLDGFTGIYDIIRFPIKEGDKVLMDGQEVREVKWLDKAAGYVLYDTETNKWCYMYFANTLKILD